MSPLVVYVVIAEVITGACSNRQASQRVDLTEESAWPKGAHESLGTPTFLLAKEDAPSPPRTTFHLFTLSYWGRGPGWADENAETWEKYDSWDVTVLYCAWPRFPQL